MTNIMIWRPMDILVIVGLAAIVGAFAIVMAIDAWKRWRRSRGT